MTDNSAFSSGKPALWSIPAYTGSPAELRSKTESLERRLVMIMGGHENIKFASSLAPEDMVLLDIIRHQDWPIQVFTLETGRLNAETLELLEAVESHYDYTIERYTPEPDAVANYVAQHGENAFYDSIEMRKLCCGIRKVEPLNRALSGADAWLTGQRREQSVTRGELKFEEFDEARGIAKYNPLFDWTEAEVWAYLDEHQVPVNALHEKGYPSIGCEPCTRPVKVGEDVRAGRWWWENADSKECGLHKA